MTHPRARRLLLGLLALASACGPAGASCIGLGCLGQSTAPAITSDNAGHLIFAYPGAAAPVTVAVPAASGLTPYPGDGSPPGTPGFLIVDRSNGNATTATATQMPGLLAGGLIQTPPSAPSVSLGAPSYVNGAFQVVATITGSATGSTGITYQVGTEAAGAAAFTPAAAASSPLAAGVNPPTVTIAGLLPSTAYTAEVVAANGGGTATSALVTFSTPAAPPETATVAALSGSYTAGSAVPVSGTVQNSATVYVSLSTGGAEQGQRVPASVSGGNWTASVTPSAAGSYTASAYAAASGGTALATTAAFSVAAPPPGTTLSSAVLASNGTSLTLTFSQAVTLILSDFSVSVVGTADSFTDSDASTSQTTHVLTLGSAAASGQAVTISASPVGATTPPLGATFSGTAATNNSTVAAMTGPVQAKIVQSQYLQTVGSATSATLTLPNTPTGAVWLLVVGSDYNGATIGSVSGSPTAVQPITTVDGRELAAMYYYPPGSAPKSVTIGGLTDIENFAMLEVSGSATPTATHVGDPSNSGSLVVGNNTTRSQDLNLAFLEVDTSATMSQTGGSTLSVFNTQSYHSAILVQAPVSGGATISGIPNSSTVLMTVTGLGGN